MIDCQIIFYNRKSKYKEFYMNIFSFLTKYIAIKNHNLKQNDFTCNHISIVINGCCYEAINKIVKTKFDIEKIEKNYDIKVVNYMINEKAVDFLEKRVGEKYSFLKALASANLKKIIGKRLGNYIEKYIDKFASYTKGFFCSYLVSLCLLEHNKGLRKDYLYFVKKRLKDHQLNLIKKPSNEKIALETTPADLHQYFFDNSEFPKSQI